MTAGRILNKWEDYRMMAEDNGWYVSHQCDVRKPIPNNRSMWVVIPKSKPIKISW